MVFNQWSEIIQTNLNSNFQILQSILPNMLANKYGKITSIYQLLLNRNPVNQIMLHLNLLIGLYKSIAIEVAKRNINVNLISPGFINTPMTQEHNDIQKNNYLSIFMGKFGTPEDVATLVYFLFR